MATKTTKKVYTWGTLRQVYRGTDYRCVIHPEDWEKIDALAEGDIATFTDEQGIPWVAQRQGDAIVFRAGQKLLTAPKGALA